MNVGFSNLDTLKKNLLAGTMQQNVGFDAVIKDIGLWTFGVFEEQTSRKFERAQDTDEFQCDRTSFIVSRYPIEIITAVETQTTESDPWQAQDLGIIASVAKRAGVIYLGDVSDAGKYWSKIRFTYTGGYWWEQEEPESPAGYPSEKPASAIALPFGLRGAWIAQCRLAWQAIDKLGRNLLTQGSTAQFVSGSLAGLEILPLVQKTITDYTKMDLI